YGSDRYVFVKSAKTAEELVTAENTLVNPSQKLKNNPNNADMALNKLTMDKTGRFITVSFYSDTMAKTKQPINLKELYFFGEKPIEGVCNLEFDTMGGSALEKQNAAQGVLYSTLTIPTPVKVGYNFGGWSDTAGGVALDFATAVVPAELKHTLYAVWNLIESSETVQLDLQGGDHADAVGGIVSIPSVATGTLWSTVLSGKAPTKTIDGNTFNLRGWYYDAALTLPVGATDVVLQGKTVLYAKYIIPVKLNVNTNTGVYEDGTTIEKTIEVIPDTPIGKTVYDTLMSYRVKKESADTIYEFRGFSKRNNNDLSTLINEKTVFAET
ncbi:MAG: InlB B-repeat-containing protein, partial [Oscillospiraceae bacterium]